MAELIIMAHHMRCPIIPEAYVAANPHFRYHNDMKTGVKIVEASQTVPDWVLI